jgi:oligoribonuclease (3'-5' exoribonuclease)
MNNTALVWADLETGGLNGRLPNEQLGMEYYPILEIAIIVTDENLVEQGDPLRIVIHQPESEIEKCSEWALKKHSESGLLDEVRLSTISLVQAQNMILDHLQWLGIDAYDRESKTGGILCGSSIMFDRTYLMAQMPELHEYLHYRQLDVSAINLAMRMFNPDLAEQATDFKKYTHEALADIRESIEELRIYRTEMLQTDFVMVPLLSMDQLIK